MKKLGFVLVLGMAACGGGSKKGTLGHDGGGGKGSLAAALTSEVGHGGPVAIVPTGKGLVALSADGARRKTLVDGPIRWALVDNRADVVWFGKPDGTTIEVLDLRGPAASPKVTTVVTGLPTETDAGVPLITVEYREPTDDIPLLDDLTTGHPITPHVVLSVEATPGVYGAGGILDQWEQTEAFDAKVKEAKLPGQALIAELAARGKGKWSTVLREPVEHRVDGLDLSNCEDQDYCGKAEEITPSLWRVVTTFACGDGCYTGWRLWDPAKKALNDAAWAAEISDVWLAPDASAVVSNGIVIRLDSGPVAGSPGLDSEDRALGGGWLGGGTYLP